MTTLPSIHQARGSAASVNKSPNPAPVGSHAKMIQNRGAQRRQTRFMTQHEQELLKKARIRQNQPVLTKVDTAFHRNSYIHNLCVGMLKEGYHLSFNELFTLNSKRKAERLEAGPDSVLWEETPLEEQHEKLDQIGNFLTKAEFASRLNKWDDVYACRHALAQYFLEFGDLWLSDHFFETALQTSLHIKLDGRRRESEAHCHMSLACERRGELENACNHMQEFYELTVGRLWADENDINLHHIACRHLCRLYSLRAEQITNIADVHAFLHKAYKMSQEGEDKLQESDAAYRLGCAYETSHDSETAIEYLNHSLTIASQHKENVLVGKVCKALAKSHQTLGAITKSIEFLEIFVATAKANGLKHQLIEACNCLGTIYNNLGRYDKSVGHFVESYEVSQELKMEEESNMELEGMTQEETSHPDLDDCASQLGVVLGNQLLNAFASNMEINERVMMERIVSWKDERMNEFGLPLPQPKPPTPFPEAEKTPDPTEPFTEVDRLQQEGEGRQVEGQSSI